MTARHSRNTAAGLECTVIQPYVNTRRRGNLYLQPLHSASRRRRLHGARGRQPREDAQPVDERVENLGQLVLCLRGQREHVMLEREALQRGQGLHLERVAVEREAREPRQRLQVDQLVHL